MDPCAFCESAAVYANPMRCDTCEVAYQAGKQDALPTVSVPSTWTLTSTVPPLSPSWTIPWNGPTDTTLYRITHSGTAGS